MASCKKGPDRGRGKSHGTNRGRDNRCEKATVEHDSLRDDVPLGAKTMKHMSSALVLDRGKTCLIRSLGSPIQHTFTYNSG